MNALQEYVKQRGAISVAEFMELALLHPDYGYYQKQRAIGASGDFVTAPEISQVFGELIGMWLAYNWQQCGSPKGALVELGPGRGTLMHDLLRATKHVPGFHRNLPVHLVEKGAAMCLEQEEKLKYSGARITWHDTIDTLPKLPLFIVANEFFDALPIRQFERKNDTWFERFVAWDDSNQSLIFTPSLKSEDLSKRAIARDAKMFETCETGEAIMKKLARTINMRGGAMLIIDYGYEGGSRIDTLQAVRGHVYADILTRPGECDLTAHVDFDTLKAIAEAAGLQANIEPQGKFLLELGAEIRAQTLCKALDEQGKKSILEGVLRLVSPQQMGTLFKVLSCRHPSIKDS